MPKKENRIKIRKGTFTLKSVLAQMLKSGMNMDMVNPGRARIAESAGAVAVTEAFFDLSMEDARKYYFNRLSTP